MKGELRQGDWVSVTTDAGDWVNGHYHGDLLKGGVTFMAVEETTGTITWLRWDQVNGIVARPGDRANA